MLKKFIKDYQRLLRNVPSDVIALFTLSVVLMNLLANKEIDFGVSWLALDCGFTLSWLSFLCMDMITKRFGPKASVKISMFAIFVNLVSCLVFYGVSKIPGNWGEFYTYGLPEVNQSLDATIGGTWYVLLGSTIAFAVSSVVNAGINALIGKLRASDTFKDFALRSYISTLVAQFVDNMLFALIVSHTFFGWSFLQCVTCSLTGCILELLCEIVFSPIGYKVCKRWQHDNVGSEYLDMEVKNDNK
nr:MAG TPA: Putative vitamin uptake transporter [Caudoviricetes sp.]